MNKTGFLFDQQFLLHDTGPDHPEASERLVVILKGLESAGLLPHLTRVPAKPADMR
jgi:acetoin utilization deacetylase AcuC-like enzyme